ncbi:MAG: hypothetical protein QOG20_2801 [Pseudonocardiales bacterium]|jgi:hypothetical protein|nr:hypothetical protein [Pseudonocardiales bacterium]
MRLSSGNPPEVRVELPVVVGAGERVAPDRAGGPGRPYLPHLHIPVFSDNRGHPVKGRAA